MKRAKKMLILGLLSLFLGVTTVTTHAQSHLTTVEVGITFTEDGRNEPDSETKPGENSSGDTSTTGRLPQTGGTSSPSLIIIGILCLGLLFYLVRGDKKRTK